MKKYIVNQPFLKQLDGSTDLTKCQHVETGEVFTRSILGDLKNPFNHLQIGDIVSCVTWNTLLGIQGRNKKVIVIGFVFSEASNCWFVETKKSNKSIRIRFYSCVRKVD